MATQTRFRQACDEILSSAHSGEDALATRFHIMETLQRAVGFNQWSWSLADPASGLGISGIGAHEYWHLLPTLLRRQQRRGTPAARADSVRCDGDYQLSATFRELLDPVGLVDQIRRDLRDAGGAWGSVDLIRADGTTRFSAQERSLVESVAPALRLVARRSVCGEPLASWARADLAPGTLLIDDKLAVRAATAPGRAWLDEIPGDSSRRNETGPAAVLNVASRAWARHEGFAAHGPPTVRARTLTGTWVVVRADRFDDETANTVAVTISEAMPSQVLDLRLLAHDLTRRESQIARLLLHGHDTRSLSEHLAISSYTVQDHLKSVFRKLGVQSRRELIALLNGH